MAVVARDRRLAASPVESGRRFDWPGTIGRALVYLVLVVLAVIFIAPFAWMVSASLQDVGDMFRWPPQWIPRSPDLGNFALFF